MKKEQYHIDEHTLTQYVLNDPKVSAQRGDIRQHLAECVGCRALYEEIASFYSQTEREISANALLGKRHKNELMPVQKLPSVWTDPVSAVIPKTEISVPARIWYFARRKPIVSATLSFAMMAIVLAVINLVGVVLKDTNPSYVTFSDHVLIVHNRAGEILWKKPLSENHRMQEDDVTVKSALAIIDVNNDGKNEVVTIFNPLNEDESLKNSITVYNYDGSVLWRKYLGAIVSHSNRQYMNDYATRRMFVHKYQGKPGIFVVISNAHSPSALLILDLKGNIQAEHWNYGHITDFLFADVDRDGKDEVVISTFLDEENFPAIVALDPEKIIGTKQSRYSAFNGISLSDAEKYSLILTMDEKFTTVRNTFYEMRTMEGKLKIHYGPSPNWLFTCMLGEKLYCEELLPTDTAIERYGKEGVFREAEKLKKRMKYWSKQEEKPPA